MPKGGARKGAGRKPVHDEMQAKELCQSAIVAKFGSLDAGVQFLLESGEPALLKFVFEHAIGKPVDKIDAKVQNDPINLIMPDGIWLETYNDRR